MCVHAFCVQADIHFLMERFNSLERRFKEQQEQQSALLQSFSLDHSTYPTLTLTNDLFNSALLPPTPAHDAGCTPVTLPAAAAAATHPAAPAHLCPFPTAAAPAAAPQVLAKVGECDQLPCVSEPQLRRQLPLQLRWQRLQRMLLQ
jgi:hypothetical protein